MFPSTPAQAVIASLRQDGVEDDQILDSMLDGAFLKADHIPQEVAEEIYAFLKEKQKINPSI